MAKRALITGIAGQDGSYLTELLLDKGYEVHGIIRRVASEHPEDYLWRIRHLRDQVSLYPGRLENYANLVEVVQQVNPNECYHLAAQSFVSYSFDDEFSTITTNINGTHFLLSAIKETVPQCRFYFAGSSEMFGNPTVSPQDETTSFNPRSPYGISKLAGFHLCRSYRELYGLQACCGILFNHESPRRGCEYVTRKITTGVAKIKYGKLDKLRLGNLKARRDWGYAEDYVRAMWLTLQAEKPDDYVIATGETHSVEEFLELAFEHVHLNWRDHVMVDQFLFRPGETHVLRGDSSKAQRNLDWRLTVDFKDLVAMMVEADLKTLRDAE